ncbi:MAG: hypothetical protein HUK26_09950, partial [Duodenibacillus sp.]|nr:hypothetical protein [Duodenibacillus sp.]
DVKATFERVMTSSALRRRALYGMIRSVEAVTDHRVLFRLREPFSAFINLLAHPASVIMSRRVIAGAPETIASRPVGTGPFVFSGAAPEREVRVRRFDDYWRPGWPRLEGVRWVTVPAAAERLAMLERGEADVVAEYPLLADVPPAVAARYRVTGTPSVITRFLYLNLSKFPFSDPAARQTLNCMIRRKALADRAFGGMAMPADSLVPPGIDGAVALPPAACDAYEARSRLAQAGLKDGEPLVLWCDADNSVNRRVAEELAGQLGRSGIRLSVRYLTGRERREWMGRRGLDASCPAAMYLGKWSSSTGEADGALRLPFGSAFAPPAGGNIARYASAAFDERLREARLATDPVRRRAALADAQRQLAA